MSKFKDNFRKYLKTYLSAGGISLGVGLLVFFLYFFIQHMTYVAALNGTGMAFVILFAAGVLVWLSKEGAFDTISFGFKQMFTSWFNKEANKYNDFVGYRDEKNSKRLASSNIHFVFLMISALFLIAFGIIEIIKYSIYGG